MRFLFYTHSLVSDWNHGNAHFLRGVMRDLLARGHDAVALEPADAWSRQNLLADAGPAAVEAFHRDFPLLTARRYGGVRWPRKNGTNCTMPALMNSRFGSSMAGSGALGTTVCPLASKCAR